MNLIELLAQLTRLMPGVILTLAFDSIDNEIIVNTSLISHECQPDDTQLLTTESGLEFDAFALSDAIFELLPDADFSSDHLCRSYISTGLKLTSAVLEPTR
jgi:hypothetical protein